MIIILIPSWWWRLWLLHPFAIILWPGEFLCDTHTVIINNKENLLMIIRCGAIINYDEKKRIDWLVYWLPNSNSFFLWAMIGRFWRQSHASQLERLIWSNTGRLLGQNNGYVYIVIVLMDQSVKIQWFKGIPPESLRPRPPWNGHSTPFHNNIETATWFAHLNL